MTYVCTIKVDINTLDGFVHCTHVARYFLVYMGDEMNYGEFVVHWRCREDDCYYAAAHCTTRTQRIL